MGYLSSSSSAKRWSQVLWELKSQGSHRMITVVYNEGSIKEANMTPGICKYVKKTVKSLIEEDVKNPFPPLQVQVKSWS